MDGPRDAVSEDSQLIDDVANLGRAASSSATSVKVEEKTPDELQRENIEALKKEPVTHSRKRQYQNIDARQIHDDVEAKQQDAKYAKLLFKDCKETLVAISEIILFFRIHDEKGTSVVNVEKVMTVVVVIENNIKDLNDLDC